MTDKQPEALRLADAVTDFSRYATESEEAAKYRRFVSAKEAAAELRRLHEINAELEEALRLVLYHDSLENTDSVEMILAYVGILEETRASLAKAEGK